MARTNGIDWHAAAACFLYTMRLCGMGGYYDLATHVCNYWRCDDVIQLRQGDAATDDDGVDTLWQTYDDLKRRMQLDADYHQSPQSPSLVARRLHERIACWTSPSYGSMLIPPSQYGHIPNGMFQQYDKLCVLKLSACAFSFKAPPFLCCHSLQFLWLDHCREESGTDGVGNEEDIQRCFQRLWVLDVRYSSSEFLSAKMMHFMTELRELNVMGQYIGETDMGALQEQLPNICKLRAGFKLPTGPAKPAGSGTGIPDRFGRKPVQTGRSQI
ncbi:hypothetical protein PVAP13_8NG063200 [Panicum virgatum]|uniref:Uncharacterized protein n=2 Tax=Panicum virgatum TaxID=38727 RepID=A0A8T0P597_PANVG|nr:hypothetical protein PVAP13_8NG063200 [Panicum virgatum]